MKQLFPLGELIITPGAMLAEINLGALLRRHATGDFGVVSDEDAEVNRAAAAGTDTEALATDGRILSAYPIDPDKPCVGHGENTVWILTEADCSRTTILLPEEF